MYRSSEKDTIFAPLTIKGKCSVFVIKISGNKTRFCMKTLGIKNIKKGVSLCNLKDGNEDLDQALVLYFESPNSFTGEDVCELNLHCSSYIINRVFSILSSIDGVRIAENGEFSKRAFLNNKMDLVQAESILDLVNSETYIQHKQAIKQLKGENSIFFEELRNDILNISSNIEASIDFPDDINEINLNGIETLINKIENILSDNDIAKKIKNGLNISIIGEPNAGKSTLMNYLAKRDIAIVSNIAGTTRDIIEVSMDIDGVLVNIYDTAGIRETDDEIEKEGVRRAIENAKNADLKILLITPDNVKINKKIEDLIDKNTIIVLNKIDTKKENINFDREIVEVSIKNNINMNILLDKIKDFIEDNITPYTNTNITNERYRVELKEVLKNLKEININLPIEIIGEKIRLAAFCVGKITGIISTDDILNNIFSKFCIGK